MEDVIAEVGIDDVGRLFVRPSKLAFDYIYRAAMEVHWDAPNKRLFSPKPRQWTYLRWYRQILAAAADEYSARLTLGPSTIWTNVPDSLKLEIESVNAS